RVLFRSPTNVSAPCGSSSSRATKSRGIAAAESEAVIGAVSHATTDQQSLKRAQQKQAGQVPRSNRPSWTFAASTEHEGVAGAASTHARASAGDGEWGWRSAC